MDDPDVILPVEDNPNDVVEPTLAAPGENQTLPEAFAVNDDKEALDYLSRKEPHELRPEANLRAVLLDLKLPNVGGLEVSESIKTDPCMETIPVVMLTSLGEEKDLLKSYNFSTKACVVK